MWAKKRPQNVATQCNKLLHCVLHNVIINIIIIITLCKVEFKLSLHPIT